MTDEQEAVVVPARYSRVDPWVISPDTGAEIQFLEASFDATETPGSRMLGPDSRIGHVEVDLGDAVIMLLDAGPGWPPLPSYLRVYVADTQRAVDRAAAAGARVVTQPTELPFGERVARVRDPQGHLWWIHEHVETSTPPISPHALPIRQRNRRWPMSRIRCPANCPAFGRRFAFGRDGIG